MNRASFPALLSWESMWPRSESRQQQPAMTQIRSFISEISVLFTFFFVNSGISLVCGESSMASKAITCKIRCILSSLFVGRTSNFLLLGKETIIKNKPNERFLWTLGECCGHVMSSPKCLFVADSISVMLMEGKWILFIYQKSTLRRWRILRGDNFEEKHWFWRQELTLCYPCSSTVCVTLRKLLCASVSPYAKWG